MGATRAQKEAYFNRLRELVTKFRTSMGFISSRFLMLVLHSFHLRGQC